ncbi:hypothetical protein B5G04_07940 [Bacteroides sp. An51A]|nr:hypothetical protein B5G04_07940 [Bacteroides sp. An51A]
MKETILTPLRYATRYNMGSILYIYKQNERHIVFILLMVEIGDFYLRIKQKRFLYVCPVFSQTMTLQR